MCILVWIHVHVCVAPPIVVGVWLVDAMAAFWVSPRHRALHPIFHR